MTIGETLKVGAFYSSPLVKGFREVADDNPGGECHKGMKWGLGGIHIRKRRWQRHSWEVAGICMPRDEGSFGFGVPVLLGEKQ